MSPAQFNRWMLYAQVEPFGMDEGDFRAAVLNGSIAAAVGAKVDPEVFTLRHFIDELNAVADGSAASSVERFDSLVH
jgi:hypothetical protein